MQRGRLPTSERPAETTRPRRVLIVDDDAMLREVAGVALEVVGGWEVVTAGSGGEAQVVAVDQQPDAILLDVMRPGMDGPSTVARLRANPVTAHIPIIFLTAKVRSTPDAWPELELAGVIPKPFDPMTLPTQISVLLGWAD